MESLLPLVGVAVGAVLTYLLSWRADKRRWERDDEVRRRDIEREDQLRWIADRRRLYADYLAAARRAEELGKIAQSGFQFAKHLDDAGKAASAVDEESRATSTWDQYVAATVEMGHISAELELVGPSNVAAIAAELNVAVIGLVNALTRETRGSPSPQGALEREAQVTKIEERHRALVEEFKRTVRYDLGVDGDSPPRGRDLTPLRSSGATENT